MNKYSVEYTVEMIRQLQALTRLLQAKLTIAKFTEKNTISIEGDDWKSAFLLIDSIANAIAQGQPESEETFLGIDNSGNSVYDLAIQDSKEQTVEFV